MTLWSHRPPPRFPPVALVVLLALGVLAAPGCGTNPEQDLVGCWVETGWEYERVDDRSTPIGSWSDGVRLRSYPDRSLVRHEGELWEFRGRGALAIGDRAGALTSARWRLKGRGHVLTIRQGEDRFEVYDIKELSAEKDRRIVLEADLSSTRQALDETRGVLSTKSTALERATSKIDADRASLDRAKDALAVALSLAGCSSIPSGAVGVKCSPLPTTMIRASSSSPSMQARTRSRSRRRLPPSSTRSCSACRRINAWPSS